MKILVIIAFVFSTVAFVASAETRSNGTFVAMDEFDGTMYFQTIIRDDLQGMPSWDPEIDPCPLTITKAIHLARARISNRFPQEKDWTLKSISLQPVLRTDKWIYRICFTTDLGEEYRPPQNGMSIVVALNGWFPNIEENEKWKEAEQSAKRD